MQDLGDDVWLFVAALLPRIAIITVSPHSFAFISSNPVARDRYPPQRCDLPEFCCIVLCAFALIPDGLPV
jgi:hypothetical protein